MNKLDLIKSVARNTGKPIGDVAVITDAVISAIQTEVCSHKKVSLGNFGSFEATYRAPRTGRNPHTGEAVPIPSRYIPVFRPGKQMVEDINRKG